MRIEQIVDIIHSSFDSLLTLLESEVKIDLIEEWQMKIVLEGRREAFLVASSQLNQLKDLEKQIEIFDLHEYQTNAQNLLNAVTEVQADIAKITKIKINPDFTEDEKWKSIVQAKRIGVDFLLEINAFQAEMKYNLENNVGEGAPSTKDFAAKIAKGE